MTLKDKETLKVRLEFLFRLLMLNDATMDPKADPTKTIQMEIGTSVLSYAVNIIHSRREAGKLHRNPAELDRVGQLVSKVVNSVLNKVRYIQEQGADVMMQYHSIERLIHVSTESLTEEVFKIYNNGQPSLIVPELQA